MIDLPRLLQIEARLKAATPGPYWTCNGDGVFSDGREGVSLRDDNDETSLDSLEMLAHAPADLSALVSALRIAVRELTELSEGDARSIAGQALAEIAKVVG